MMNLMVTLDQLKEAESELRSAQDRVREAKHIVVSALVDEHLYDFLQPVRLSELRRYYKRKE